jgi:hypothetical protein
MKTGEAVFRETGIPLVISQYAVLSFPRDTSHKVLFRMIVSKIYRQVKLTMCLMELIQTVTAVLVKTDIFGLPQWPLILENVHIHRGKKIYHE